MRITGGSHRGRPLAVPAGRTTRPTSDKARQALFNILAHGVEDFSMDGARVADLFAGSGALGLEALSRGAGRCVFVESDRAARDALGRNVDGLGLADRAVVLGRDVRRLPKADQPVDLVFMDPPYGKGLVGPALQALTRCGWLAPGTLLVIETAADEPPDLPGEFDVIDHRIHGAARISFVRERSSPE